MHEIEDRDKMAFHQVIHKWNSLPKLRVRFEYIQMMVDSKRYGYSEALVKAQSIVQQSIKMEG